MHYSERLVCLGLYQCTSIGQWKHLQRQQQLLNFRDAVNMYSFSRCPLNTLCRQALPQMLGYRGVQTSLTPADEISSLQECRLISSMEKSKPRKEEEAQLGNEEGVVLLYRADGKASDKAPPGPEGSMRVSPAGMCRQRRAQGRRLRRKQTGDIPLSPPPQAPSPSILKLQDNEESHHISYQD